MKKNSSALIQLYLAVMLFGLSGVIGRAVHVSSITLAGGRVICSSILLCILLCISRKSLHAKTKTDVLVLCAAGALLALHWSAFFQSVQSSGVAIGTITFSTFPLFLLILEPVIYKEKFSRKNGILCVFLLIGILITLPSFSLSDTATIGFLWGMVSSLTYAFLTLCNRFLSPRYESTFISFREQSLAAILLLPLLILRHEPVHTTDLAGILAIGILCTALAFSLFVSAQKKVSAQTAGIVSGMETVYGILFALVFLHEIPSLRSIIGGAIIIIVCIITNLIKDETT